MARKLLSIEDLVQFCQTQNFHKFSAAETGYQLSVQVPAVAVYKKEEVIDETLLFCKVKLFHIGRNRNGSNVTRSAAEKALSTIAYKPLLANFCEIDGIKDFTSHDMNILEDGTVEYIEKQIGAFTADKPYIEYDAETGNDFVYAYAAIPREYTEAADIIERKDGTKVSVELIINAMSYDAKEKVLDLEDIIVQGATCLGKNPDTGKNVEEGMYGARLDIADFSTQNNSASFTCNEELLNEIKKLNENLSRFNIYTKLEEGGNETVNKFEELLAQYNVTVEDITFDYENLTDEELEAKFAEVFAEDTGEEGEQNPEPTSDGESDVDNENVDNSDGSTEENFSTQNNEEKMIRTYEISHDDIRYALYNLLGAYESADNEWYWINAVYDTYFTYENWDGSRIYGQSYTKEDDNVSFDGDRYSLHRELLTDSEYAELCSMRSNYAAIETQLKDYQKKEEDAQKDALFTSTDYSSIADKQEFETLKNNHSDFSLDELKNKLDEIILNYAKSGSLTFAVVEPVVEKPVKKVSLPTEKKTKSRYGSLKFN